MNTMRELKLKVTVERLDLDAVHWGLYTQSMKCDKVALALNNAFMACVNGGMGRDETQTRMDKIRLRYEKYGAADSEGSHMLKDLLDQVFGE